MPVLRGTSVDGPVLAYDDPNLGHEWFRTVEHGVEHGCQHKTGRNYVTRSGNTVCFIAVGYVLFPSSRGRQPAQVRWA